MDAYENARTKFFWQRCVHLLDGRKSTVAILLRQEDWRPLDAPWWREKQASIIGADIDGNFFLRHCDGSVRFWDHKLQVNIVVAPSVQEFAQMITEGDESVA
ncbi:MAG TPA: hypothetical protein VGU61_14760 [Noviherbaspirillum sp.]|jgi:hypothetical protein|uniref:hypothetical protein n=1 Tax=Noviherbaspirillum sp. TaxID=1926288 RepID=UPI002DDD3DA5|nr:hypothetical protein [Noviherbaspirillum sp.]HEV2611528.1 hypothetical protein [Noviherbaspirillum sp.]